MTNRNQYIVDRNNRAININTLFEYFKLKGGKKINSVDEFAGHFEKWCMIQGGNLMNIPPQIVQNINNVLDNYFEITTVHNASNQFIKAI